jgi:hypothetical protein
MKIVKRDINKMEEMVFMEYIDEVQGLFIVEGLNKFNEEDGVYYQLVTDYYRLLNK